MYKLEEEQVQISQCWVSLRWKAVRDTEPIVNFNLCPMNFLKKTDESPDNWTLYKVRSIFPAPAKAKAEGKYLVAQYTSYISFMIVAIEKIWRKCIQNSPTSITGRL